MTEIESHARGDNPYLVAQAGPLQGQRWVIDRDAMLIGRGEECDIAIVDRQISRHHARLRRSGEGVLIEDLGSKNGTHVNGVRLSAPALLQDGDVIQIAFTLELIFVAHDATLPMEGTGFGRVGRLRMDPRSHQVWIGEAELSPPLSAPQYRLLEALLRQPSAVVSREEIVDQVWPDAAGAGVSEQAIDALVRRLRDRLAELDPDHPYIVTVRGHGFRLENPPIG
jgi:DNA-binding response OmpR family regulator